MKRVKIGIAMIFLAAAIYCIVSFGIFFDKKVSIDTELQSLENSLNQKVKQQGKDVVIQSVAAVTCHECNNPLQQDDVRSDLILTNDLDEQEMPELIVDNKPQFVVQPENQQKPTRSYVSSFITMSPIPTDYVVDEETQNILDVLVGNDVDEFVRLVLQSNNNIVSKEACRSCGMYAFFNAIKQHKQLTVKDIVLLQKLLTNLYRFIEKMKKLSNEPLLLPEQYEALQDLHRSQNVKNDIKLKKRFAATSAALKKLQNIKYNR